MDGLNDREQEFQRREQELKAREQELRLRELETEIYEQDRSLAVPFHETRKHNEVTPRRKRSLWQRLKRNGKLAAQLLGLVIFAVVALRVASMLVSLTLIAMVASIGYLVLFAGKD